MGLRWRGGGGVIETDTDTEQTETGKIRDIGSSYRAEERRRRDGGRRKVGGRDKSWRRRPGWGEYKARREDLRRAGRGRDGLEEGQKTKRRGRLEEKRRLRDEGGLLY